MVDRKPPGNREFGSFDPVQWSRSSIRRCVEHCTSGTKPIVQRPHARNHEMRCVFVLFVVRCHGRKKYPNAKKALLVLRMY